MYLRVFLVVVSVVGTGRRWRGSSVDPFDHPCGSRDESEHPGSPAAQLLRVRTASVFTPTRPHQSVDSEGSGTATNSQFGRLIKCASPSLASTARTQQNHSSIFR